MVEEALYEANVASLKKADRRNRLFKSFLIFALEVIFILYLYFLLPLMLMIVVFFLLSFTFMPAPFFPTPSSYKIREGGVILYDRRVFSLRRAHRIKVNEKRKFVSILHRWRGEVLRLYSPEPGKVLKALEKSIYGFHSM
jgi:uncharacterized membrane protein